MQVKRVRCESSGVLVPKDKAIKRFIVRNIVDASAIRDIQDASVLEGQFALSCTVIAAVLLSVSKDVCRAACRRMLADTVDFST